jgi:hypothetical protein
MMRAGRSLMGIMYIEGEDEGWNVKAQQGNKAMYDKSAIAERYMRTPNLIK